MFFKWKLKIEIIYPFGKQITRRIKKSEEQSNRNKR
jgi:hypothetical protein